MRLRAGTTTRFARSVQASSHSPSTILYSRFCFAHRRFTNKNLEFFRTTINQGKIVISMRVNNIKKSIKVIRIIIPAYIKSWFKPIPLWIHLYVTRKCNLNCKYCFVRDNTKEDLNEEQLKKIIDHLYYLGCRAISFFGGEPTIRKDFINIVKYTSQKGMITHMSTNGLLLTPEYIKKLGKAGIDIINLSIDSIFQLDGSKKDIIRNKKVINDLIEMRKEYGFEINVNMVLTNKNINSAIQIIELINKYKIAISIGYIITNTYNDLPQDESLFFKTEEEKRNLFIVLDKIKELRKKGYNIIDPIQYFDDIKKFIEGNLDWYCCAGKYYFSVDSDGKFQICAGLPPERLSIFDIDKDYYKKLTNIREKRLNKCKKICLSNCLYDTSYFIKNPLYFIKEIFKFRKNQS